MFSGGVVDRYFVCRAVYILYPATRCAPRWDASRFVAASFKGIVRSWCSSPINKLRILLKHGRSVGAGFLWQIHHNANRSKHILCTSSQSLACISCMGIQEEGGVEILLLLSPTPEENISKLEYYAGQCHMEHYTGQSHMALRRLYWPVSHGTLYWPVSHGTQKTVLMECHLVYYAGQYHMEHWNTICGHC